jgi:hypothetical protein
VHSALIGEGVVLEYVELVGEDIRSVGEVVGMVGEEFGLVGEDVQGLGGCRAG